MRLPPRAAAAAALFLAVASCADSPQGPGPSPRLPPPPQTPPQAAVFVGAGDIGVCGYSGSAGTASLLDSIDGTVFTLGDNAYFQGTAQQYRDCYDPTWGRHKDRTRPAPGNHEYETAGASAYFGYFGDSAGPPGRGYYSFDLGGWHIVSLNSNISASDSSVQMQWLRDDLAANPSRCVGAIWHHPLFSSGINGPSAVMREVWRTLHRANAEFVLVGHEHWYERFARVDEAGRPTPDGLRQFVIGTGGAPLTTTTRVSPNSEVRASVHGVLRLTLRPDAYTWQFLSTPPETFSDSGNSACR